MCHFCCCQNQKRKSSHLPAGSQDCLYVHHRLAEFTVLRPYIKKKSLKKTPEDGWKIYINCAHIYQLHKILTKIYKEDICHYDFQRSVVNAF